MQSHIATLIHHLDTTESHILPNALAEDKDRSISLPTHLYRTFHTLSDADKARFMQYISPLLSPPHALPAGVPQAYQSAILLSRNRNRNGGVQLLTLAVDIVAIQNSAAVVILYFIPPLTPIELLHRTICIALLRHVALDAFVTSSTACKISRSFLGRF